VPPHLPPPPHPSARPINCPRHQHIPSHKHRCPDPRPRSVTTRRHSHSPDKHRDRAKSL
jgi:hypothetical protein